MKKRVCLFGLLLTVFDGSIISPWTTAIRCEHYWIQI